MSLLSPGQDSLRQLVAPPRKPQRAALKLNRATFLGLAGPFVSIVLIVGPIALLRTRERRSVDGWLAAGTLIFVVFLLITGGKAYYAAASYPALLAVGAGPVLDWIRIRTWRCVLPLHR